MLPGFFRCDDNDEFGYFGFLHPFAELGHDFFHVCFDLIVDGDHHVEAIFFYGREVFGWVDAALEEDCVAGEFEEFGYEFGAAFELEFVGLGFVGG